MTARQVLVGEKIVLGRNKSFRIDLTKTPLSYFNSGLDEVEFPRVNYTLWGSSQKLITRLFNGTMESFMQGRFIEHYLEDDLIDDYYHTYDRDDSNAYRSLIIRPVMSLRRILDIGYHKNKPRILTLRSDFSSLSHSVFVQDSGIEIVAAFQGATVLA